MQQHGSVCRYLLRVCVCSSTRLPFRLRGGGEGGGCAIDGSWNAILLGWCEPSEKGDTFIQVTGRKHWRYFLANLRDVGSFQAAGRCHDPIAKLQVGLLLQAAELRVRI